MTTPPEEVQELQDKHEGHSDTWEHPSAGANEQNGLKRPRSDSIEPLPAPVLPRIEEALKRPDEARSDHSATSSSQSHPTLPSPFHIPDRPYNDYAAPPSRPAHGPDGGFVQRAPHQIHAHKHSTSSVASSINTMAGGRTPGTHQARQRTAVACRYCRKRKIRCTGISHDPNDPRCSNCRRLDQECIYAPVGAPMQGNYQRQTLPGQSTHTDPYGRGQPYHPADPRPHWSYEQPHVSQYPHPPPSHHADRNYPDYQRAFIPPPPLPHGQQYAYDHNYPSYVPHQPLPYGQFGRLKPETFAVYSSPTELPPLKEKEPSEGKGSDKGSPSQVASISNLLSEPIKRDKHDDSMLSKLLNPT